MQKLTVALITVALSCLASGNAVAKLRFSSSSHGTSHGVISGAASGVTHGLARAAANGTDKSPGPAAETSGAGGPAQNGGLDDEHAKRIRQAREEAKAKSETEYANLRKAQEAAAEEKRRAAAQEAAEAAAVAEKRALAEEQARKREEAKLEEKKRKAEWEGRCQIKGVMTDAEISTCKEVLRAHLRT